MYLGELPTAVVVLKPNVLVSEDELTTFVSARVADHKKLRYYFSSFHPVSFLILEPGEE